MQRNPDQARLLRVALLFVNRWAENTFADSLQQAGFDVQKYANALAFVAALRSSRADLALVEDQDDRLVHCLNSLRLSGVTDVPVIGVGNLSCERFALALRHGAADYILTQDSPGNMLTRVQARLEFVREPESAEFRAVGDCVLDEPSHSVRVAARSEQLTAREFGLAWVLFQHQGRVVSVQTLSEQVWGRDISVAKRTIEQHVWRLRRKLLAVTQGSLATLELQAVHNVGYRLAPETRACARDPAIEAWGQEDLTCVI